MAAKCEESKCTTLSTSVTNLGKFRPKTERKTKTMPTLPAVLAAKCDDSTCTTLQTSVTNLGEFNAKTKTVSCFFFIVMRKRENIWKNVKTGQL